VADRNTDTGYDSLDDCTGEEFTVMEAMRYFHNPDKQPTGVCTGRCPACGSDNLWDDNMHCGCNTCGRLIA